MHNIPKNKNFLIKILIASIVMLLGLSPVFSQYFGRNKPSYQRFDFKVYESPNFRIFHYFENDSVINSVANSYEKWLIRHQKLFKDTFESPSPVIIYRNHPEFQQTTVVQGTISVGTQGLAETLKNRVVMPILATNAQTDHVIGHEIVHVLQFRALFIDDSLSINSLRNIPLWMVEGQAEYFSIGSVDANTSLIIRDAIKNDNFPTLTDMTRNFRYNPYRFGHSFFAFLGRTWGDSLLVPLFLETAKFGYERAIERVIGLSANTVSDLWRSANFAHFKEYLADSARHKVIGEKLISDSNGGYMNISPSISPDGEHIAFFSEKDLFTLDLFLAEAETGRIIRKLSSTTRSADIDGFNFFESVGTWSPDGRKFVHVAVINGQNKLVIVDTRRPRRSRNIAVPGILALNNPVWSPDGRYIVFTGLADGIGNLYMLDMQTNSVERLTNDRYSYIHPSWSPDGRYIAFATDKLPEGNPNDSISFSKYLGIMDMQAPGRPIKVLDIFPSAINVNPVYDPEQKGLYFLSDRDGFRNLYFYDFEEEKVFQLTDYFTGIAGITMLSPAISVARQTGEIVYSHYNDRKYFIYRAEKDDFNFREVDPGHIDMSAATLSPLNRNVSPVVDNFFIGENRESAFPVDSFEVKDFKPQFRLSFIGSSGVGASTSRFGTGMSGGVSMLFSDIIGFNQLYTMLAVNGEVYDFGGQVGYVNRRSRISWGASASHIPYTFATLRYVPDVRFTGDDRIYEDLQFVVNRIFESQFGLFAFYPISTTRRIEIGGSIAWYYFREDIFHNYYLNGFPVGQDRSKGASRPGFNLQRINIGYIGDNSYFGMASPMNGHRYRFSVEKYFGAIDMYSTIADYRKYFFINPWSIAFRAVHLGRYGENAENNFLYPLYLGFPGYLRGYDYSSLSRIGPTMGDSFEHLIGTRVLMSGLEFKVPFTGPERLALISSGFLFTELAWFLDAGIAWNEGQSLVWDGNNRSIDQYRFPVFSTGPSLRINLFGALILEPFYAWTFSSLGSNQAVWGLNFLPGW